MASPMRLSSELIKTAEREALIAKRTVPKQIEFWAFLGKTVQAAVDYPDLMAVLQGLKKIRVEAVDFAAVEPEAVFEQLENCRDRGELAKRVTSAEVYYEASIRHPGRLDRVDGATGQRQTGMFRDGKFEVDVP